MQPCLDQSRDFGARSPGVSLLIPAPLTAPQTLVTSPFLWGTPLSSPPPSTSLLSFLPLLFRSQQHSAFSEPSFTRALSPVPKGAQRSDPVPPLLVPRHPSVHIPSCAYSTAGPLYPVATRARTRREVSPRAQNARGSKALHNQGT